MTPAGLEPDAGPATSASAAERLAGAPPEPAAAEPATDPATESPPHDASRLPGSPLAPGPLTPGGLPLPRWFAVLITVCAVGLVPWIVYLAFALPSQRRAAHYDVAWVGYDIAMFASLAALAVAAVRRSTWTEPLATFAATLLIADAWFDIVTADNRMRRMGAVASAALIELPLAAVCAWIAHNTERLRRRAYRLLLRRINTAEEEVTGTTSA